MTENNLETWQKLGKTNPEHTKNFDNGRFKGTAISPVYCYQKMTEVFGPVGFGWKAETAVEHHSIASGEILVYAKCHLYTRKDKEWSAPIEGYGGDYVLRQTKNGMKADDDAEKKAVTDALTNAMKLLGMSADVHTGRFDDNKYVQELKEVFKRDDKPVAKDPINETAREDRVFQRDFLYRLYNTDDVPSLIEEMGDRFDSLPEYINGQLTDAIEARKKQVANKVKIVPVKYGFLDVAEAVQFATFAKEQIDKLDAADIYEWMSDNDHKLKAIDTMLKTDKYRKDGKTTYERLLTAYNLKTQAAAE